VDRTAESDLWWKNAVIYCLDVETFMDGNGDGCGDFRGLTQRIGYLDGLGVTCLWLMPFYPTPNRDDGYDITDFYDVDPRLGTLGDFVEFMRAAQARGIRVITDLVVNHTSVEHPWFQSARADPDSPYRDWYVWLEEKPEDEAKVIFPDAEDSNWQWDEAAGRYYLHRFYAEQPDLNVGNPEVMQEIQRIMGFWLELGVSGFRMDAVPYFIEGTAIEEEMPEDPHVLLDRMHGFMARRRGDAILVGEVNLEPGRRERYFGETGEEMTGLFDFVLSGQVFRAVARQEAAPILAALEDKAAPPATSQWMNFVRNHDELNLSRLPDEQRLEVMEHYDPDGRARIFDRGLRRRMPPMVGTERVRLVLSLLLSLPGTPVLWYGEEIGMGDNLDLRGRLAVRTPMQWSDGPCAGFSNAAAEDLVRALVDDPEFAPDAVNVATQRRDPDSLLNFTERAIRARKECPEFGFGNSAEVKTGSEAVLALRSTWQGQSMIAVHNFSGAPQDVTLDLDGEHDVAGLTDVLADTEYSPLDVDAPRFTIGAYGYRWIRAQPETGAALT
jgi:maltose alpha-D-glucosyltransferase / alpha-amylase